MAKLECPNGHAAVIRNDPESTGYLAMCDRCGWEAHYARSEGGRGTRFEENEVRAAMEGEEERRPKELQAGTRRRSD